MSLYSGHVACRFGIFRGPKGKIQSDMCHHSQGDMLQRMTQVVETQVEAHRCIKVKYYD